LKLFSGTAKKLAEWHRGEYVPLDREDDERFPVLSGGYYIQPPLARAIDALIRFYLIHWQWIWTTLIALVGLYLAVLSLK
jgi:hypothetical protein